MPLDHDGKWSRKQHKQEHLINDTATQQKQPSDRRDIKQDKPGHRQHGLSRSNHSTTIREVNGHSFTLLGPPDQHRCGLVVKIPDFGWRDPGSIPGNDTAFLCERSPNLG